MKHLIRLSEYMSEESHLDQVPEALEENSELGLELGSLNALQARIDQFKKKEQAEKKPEPIETKKSVHMTAEEKEAKKVTDENEALIARIEAQMKIREDKLKELTGQRSAARLDMNIVNKYIDAFRTKIDKEGNRDLMKLAEELSRKKLSKDMTSDEYDKMMLGKEMIPSRNKLDAIEENLNEFLRLGNIRYRVAEDKLTKLQPHETIGDERRK